ncbi:hypothetical protein REPUB_Repub04eG0206900 [Reevesia pubescens]
MLTIFAPSDETVKSFTAKWGVYPLIFLRFIVPCKIPGKDLVKWDKTMVLETYSGCVCVCVWGGGVRHHHCHKIWFQRYDQRVKVESWDLQFQSDWLVVHGLSQELAGVAAGNGSPENS